MFTEETEKRGFPLKDFLLKLVLVIIFVLLLVWLIPWPNNDSLKDQIFNANLQEMKGAASTYFTTERLPINVGDRKTITLQEMLDMKLLIPFVDKDGKSCDVINSYVTLEKTDTEYLMKVYLKCSGEENYILVHMGCYSYCTATICEKKEEPKETNKPTNGGNGSNGGKPTVKPTTNPTTKPTTSPTPTIKPTTSPTTDPTPTIKPTTSPTTPPDVTKKYEYSKHFDATYSAWSTPQDYAYKDSDNIKFEQTDTRRVIDLGKKKVRVGTKSAVYENVLLKTRYETYVVDSVSYEVCSEWNYVVTSSGSIERIEQNWYDTGTVWKGMNPPDDTDNTKYVLERADWTQCGSDCVNNPYLIYKIYKRRSVTVGSTSNTSGITASCSKKERKSLPVEVRVPVSGLKKVLIEKEQPIYGYVKFYSVSTRKITQYGYTQYLWSNYNDKNLLNQGYKMTGKTK